MEPSAVKIGIDVGGTFTHAVALSIPEQKVLAHSQAPTTHKAEAGVAAGIVQALEKIMAEGGIGPERVLMVAHSTTQATNALLEGDVAPVGVMGLGSGLEARRAAAETDLGSLPVTQGKSIKVLHKFIDTGSDDWEKQAQTALDELVAEGARAMVAAGAFSVDDPDFENKVLDLCATKNIPATATHQISGLYGLRVRTRTAVVNASILPVMIETARRTGQGVRSLGIRAPIMVVRSDGGAMTLDQMMHRPLFTILSGPAAGVAAALSVAGISTGVFVEVGGTSTDISVMVRGRAMTRSAAIGGHRLYLNTLDVRTVGAAGGSMVRLGAKGIHDVGPRSAHIAGAGYTVFSGPEPGEEWSLKTIAPLQGDPEDYVIFQDPEGHRLTVTATCAANALDLVPDGDWAKGNSDLGRKFLGILAQKTGVEFKSAAEKILSLATARISGPISDLVSEYGLKDQGWRLVFGGGGAGTFLSFLSDQIGKRASLAPHAPVISAIGAATAMIQDQIEKSSTDPAPDEIIQLRSRVVRNVTQMGADPSSVEVFVKVDTTQNKITVTARGSFDFGGGKAGTIGEVKSPRDLAETAAGEINAPRENFEHLASLGIFSFFRVQRERKGFLGLGKRREQILVVTDGKGSVRLVLPQGLHVASSKTGFQADLKQFLDANVTFSEGGEKIPEIFIITPERIMEFNALSSLEQIQRLAAVEVENLPQGMELIITGKFK